MPGVVAVSEAPAPLVMPELEVRTRLAVSSLVSSGITINAAQLAAGGTVAFGDVEGFASLKLRYASINNLDTGAEDHGGFDLGNLKVGARYVFRGEYWRLAPSVWGWVPTSTADAQQFHDLYERVSGVEDNRSFGSAFGALGVGIDAAWYSGPSFFQVEGGIAVLPTTGYGPQLDDAFIALGGGHQFHCTSVIAEFRTELLPPDSQAQGERIYGPAIGFGRGDRQTTMWRLRFHPYVVGNLDYAGLAVAFDMVHKFE